MSILPRILVLILVVVMIVLGQGLLEAEAVVEVIGKTVMMTVTMIEVRGGEIVKIDVSMTIILLYAQFIHARSPLLLYLTN